MKSKPNIRPAEQTDLKFVLAIEQQSFGNEAFGKRQFDHLAKSLTSHFFVVDIGSIIAGYLILLTRCNSKVIRIYSVAVNPEFRGQGIGDMLISHTKSFAARMGYSTISLEVSQANSTAISLYSKYGFKEVGQKPNYYGKGKHALVMRLTV